MRITLCVVTALNLLLGSPAAIAQPVIAEYVEALIEEERRADSSDAADIFLLPFAREIDSVARTRKLPPALLAAFIQEESQWNQWAVRTEPHYLRKKKIIAEAKQWSRNFKGLPSWQTELWARSTSFGVMQVMGQVAREQGFRRRYLTELITPFHSLDEGAKHLLTKIRRYRDTLSAISAYNQGDARKQGGMFKNARYVYRVSVAWQEYEKIFATKKIYEQLENLRDLGGGINGGGIHLFRAAIMRRAGPDNIHHRKDHTEARLDADRHRDTATAVLHQGTSESTSEILIADYRSARAEPNGFVSIITGLALLLGLYWILRKRQKSDLRRYNQRVPRRLDKRVQRALRAKLEENRYSRKIHSA
jgi:hypothetical protein